MARSAAAPDYDDSEDRSWTALQQKNDEELEFFTDLAVQETQRWIECVTKKAFKYPDDPLRSLSDGVLLCELLNCLKPGCIKRVNRLSTAMAKLDNLTLFLEACKSAFGLRVEQLFSANDLQIATGDNGSEVPKAASALKLEEDRRLRCVAITVFWLARQIRGSYHGPDIDFSAFSALVAARPDVLPISTHDLSMGSSPAELDAATMSRSEGSDNEADLPRSSDCSWDGSDGRSSGQRPPHRRSLAANPLQFVALNPATGLARTAEAVLTKAELVKSSAKADSSGSEEAQRSTAEDWQGNLSSWKERRRSKSISQAQSSMDDTSIYSDGERRISKRSSAYMKYPPDDDGDSGLNGDCGLANEQSRYGVELDGSYASSEKVLGNGNIEREIDSSDGMSATDTGGGNEAGQCHVACLAPGRYRISFDSFSSAPAGFGLSLRGGSDKLEPVTVEFVSPGSPADAAGLEEGDEVIEIDNERADDKTRGHCMTIINRASRSSGSLTLIVRKVQQQQHVGPPRVEQDYATSTPPLAASVPAGQVSIEEYIDNDTGERTLRYRPVEERDAVSSAADPQAIERRGSQMPVALLRGATPDDRTDGPGKTFTSVSELRLSGGHSSSHYQPPAPEASASWSLSGGGSKFRGSRDDGEERRRMEEWAKQQEELSQAQFDRDQQLLRKNFEDDQRLAAEAELQQQQKEGDSGSASAGSGHGSKGVAPAKLDLSNLHDREARDRAAKKLQELKQKYSPTDVSESPLQRRSSQLHLASPSSSANGDTGFSGATRLSRDSSIDDRERELRKREDELRRMEDRLQQEQERIAREQQKLQQLKGSGRAADGWVDGKPAGSGRNLPYGGGGGSSSKEETMPSYTYTGFEQTQPPKELGSHPDVDLGSQMTRKEAVELSRKSEANAVAASNAAAPRHGDLNPSAASTASGRRNSFDGMAHRSSTSGSGGQQEPRSPAVVTKDDVLRATRERARYASPPSRSAQPVQRDDAEAASQPLRKSVSGFDVRDDAGPRSLSPASADDASEVVSKSMDFRSSRAMFEQQCKTAEAEWQRRQVDETQRRLQARRNTVGSAAALSRSRQQSPPVASSAGKTVQSRHGLQTHPPPSDSLGSSSATPEQLERQRELERLKASREQESAADEGAAREKERRLREERLRELAALRLLNQEYEREKQSAALASQPNATHSRGRRRSLSGSSSDDEVHRIQQAGSRQRPSAASAARLLGQDPSIAQLPPYESEQIPIMQSEQEVLRIQLERQKELEAMRRSREAHSGQDEALEELQRLQHQKALQLQRLERLKEATVSQQQPMVEVASGSLPGAALRNGNLYSSLQYAPNTVQQTAPSYAGRLAGNPGVPPAAAAGILSQQQPWRQDESSIAASTEPQWRQDETRRIADLQYQRRLEDGKRAAALEQQQQQQRKMEETRRLAELEQQLRVEEGRRAAELEQHRRLQEARRAAELEQQRRAEEARRVTELEQQRRAEEARRVAELEQQRRAEEARRAAELEQQRRAEEARRVAELEQQRRAEEARRAAELEQQRRAEEARRVTELEQQRRAEEARRVAERELQQHRAEEARRAAELEHQRRLDEARRIAELEQQHQQQQRWRQEEARHAAAAGDLAMSRDRYRPGDGRAMQHPEPQWRPQSSQELWQTPYGSSPELSSSVSLAGRGLSSGFSLNAGHKPTGELPSAAAGERGGTAVPRAEQEYAYINRRGIAAGGDRSLLQGAGSGMPYDHYYADGSDHSDLTQRGAPPGWAATGRQQQSPHLFGPDRHEPEVSHNPANTNYATYVPQQSANAPDMMRPAGDAATGRPAVWQQPGAMHRSLDEDMVSVSAKQHCAFCANELGKGAAMVIETLSLYYHVDCFRCCVCHSRLSNGAAGADVRVRGNKLHCKNCYSNDEAGVKYSAV